MIWCLDGAWTQRLIFLTCESLVQWRDDAKTIGGEIVGDKNCRIYWKDESIQMVITLTNGLKLE